MPCACSRRWVLAGDSERALTAALWGTASASAAVVQCTLLSPHAPLSRAACLLRWCCATTVPGGSALRECVADDTCLPTPTPGPVVLWEHFYCCVRLYTSWTNACQLLTLSRAQASSRARSRAENRRRAENGHANNYFSITRSHGLVHLTAGPITAWTCKAIIYRKNKITAVGPSFIQPLSNKEGVRQRLLPDDDLERDQVERDHGGCNHGQREPAWVLSACQWHMR